ncbi:MAG: hypothetical protein CO183_02765 [Candidatus Zambryskibacteria bacterium CG_4_9_14_3_um_filter_42_9]|nr:MAG: hypothetical protein CO183_02765 [Candidatus Zambryskibacteria bacterium CG_4_9_14_3_um_filter_42_9]
MRELGRKKGIRRAIYSIPAIIILAIIAFFLVKGAVGMINKKWASTERLNNLEEEVIAMANRERELREGIARLETEEGIKGEIRERFNVTEEGEHVALIVDDESASSSDDNLKSPWYMRLLNAIMNLYE